MNTILVWILVINAYKYGAHTMPVISPQMTDLESCQRLQKSITNRESQCVQIKVLVK